MQLLVGRTLRSLSALAVSAVMFAACSASEAPTSPSGGSNGGGGVVQPAPVTNGALAITVSGLPFGVAANLTVTGPSGFSRPMTTSGTLAELAPGRYTITASTVKVSGGADKGTYAPQTATQNIDVSAGPPTSALVAYAAVAAAIDVTVTGLPQGVASLVRLTPPTGGDMVVTTSMLISPAAAGKWLMNAQPVSNGGYTYTPTPVGGEAEAVPGDTLRFPVAYSLSTGALAVAITGLPAGATTTVTVTGPGTFNRTLTRTETLTDLAPGIYVVSAPALTIGGISFAPAQATQTITVSATLVAAPALVQYSAQVGSIVIASTGVPAGAVPVYTLTGSNGSRTITGDATIDSLVPGNYTVTGASVTAGGFAYAPLVPTVSLAVGARTTANARFAYAITTGVLTLATSGLPNGVNADITITGPGGFSRVASAGLTLTALSPGRYTVSARNVRTSGGTYAATPASQGVDIVAGGAVVTATVTYAPLPAVVDVNVTGLASGTPANITLTSPSGQDVSVTTTSRISPAESGRWRMTAGTVNYAGYIYRASPASADTTVALGDTLRLPVQYTLTTGAIAVAITGLPQGGQGSLTITGPNSYRSVVTTTQTVAGLVPGTYTVTAASVTIGGLPYTAAPTSQQVVVSASLVAAPATVAYAVPGGRIAFNLTGMPAGVMPTFVLTGPNGSTAVNGTAVLTVPAGSYTMTAATVTANGVSYTPAPASRALTVNINATTFAAFTYTSSGGASTGRLAFSVTGLPQNANPSFTLTGANGSTTIIGTATIDPVVAGTYTLNANNVSSGGTTYVPNPTSVPIVITAGGTSTATLSYSSGNTGVFNMAVENVYLTQATQRPDGGVTLVANRDALLRVFVTASQANTQRPDVRVRIYDGATLLQTVVLTAPEASIRTTSSEGVLASTWNTIVPAANVRATLKVLVELDPNQAITETDRTDNVWPRGGTPQTISVATVPAFNVRFVPVTIAGATGNVSEANKEGFLTSTRRYMPIRDVVSDVRAPFSSSAAALQASDGNGAWLTVLSEMNALRTTDGAPATMHYYGVVKVSYNSGVAGYGYVPGRAAIGWDYLPSGDEVAVHEWGHNFSRPHSPCDVSGDPAYPYPGGVIGMYGWNSLTNTLVSTSATDVMGYCNNQWISDWTWTKILEYRQANGFQTAALRTQAATEGLLVWGRVVDGRVILEPSFRVKAPASATPARASHRVELLDAQGGTLLDLPITADRVDHELTHDERQFAVVLPWSATLEQSLARIRVRDVRSPLASAEQMTAALRAGGSAAQATATLDPAASISSVGGSRTQLRWNTQAFPMAMVRDASTGALMGFVRNSGDLVATNGRAVEVVFSDGVRSVVKQ